MTLTWETINANGAVLSRALATEALATVYRAGYSRRGYGGNWFWKCPRRQLDIAIESGFVSYFTLFNTTTDTTFRDPDFRLCGLPVEVRHDMPEQQIELWDAGKEQLLAVICGIGFPEAIDGKRTLSTL